MSGLPPIATELRTSLVVRFVPTTEVARSFDHFVATRQHLAAMVIRAVQLAAAEALPYVLAPVVRPLHCLRRRYVIQVESPDCPAMPLPPTMPLRHSGPGRTVEARARRAFLSPADQVGSVAWHVRSARSPVPARRESFLPSRRNSMPRPNWN